ncbi:hypothetical protein FKM82_020847 [Ascaphus truei]
MLYTADTIQIPHRNREYKIRGRFTCSSSNVVYLIMCMKCPGGCYYIGETGQGLNKRMNLHRHSITRGRRDSPVGEHFSDSGHKMNDLRVAILKGNLKTPKERRLHEYKFMQLFGTLSSGLNRDRNFMSYY